MKTLLRAALCGAAGLGFALAMPASAQVANSSGARVIYDPMTNSTRVVDPGLDAGAPVVGGYTGAREPIHLHYPTSWRHHRAHHAMHSAMAAASKAKAERTASATPAVTATPSEVDIHRALPAAPKHAAAAPPHKAAPQRVAKAAPPSPQSGSNAFSFGNDLSAPQTHVPAQQPPPAQPSASPPPSRVANIAPARNIPQVSPGQKITIMFPAGAADPTAQAAASMKAIAANLNQSLAGSATRVELDAFGGAAGDKSSDARRLSLRRALAVRQLLIDAGVPSNRIDVRAMGGADDGGSSDRVDIFVKG